MRCQNTLRLCKTKRDAATSNTAERDESGGERVWGVGGNFGRKRERVTRDTIHERPLTRYSLTPYRSKYQSDLIGAEISNSTRGPEETYVTRSFTWRSSMSLGFCTSILALFFPPSLVSCQHSLVTVGALARSKERGKRRPKKRRITIAGETKTFVVCVAFNSY